MHIGGGGNSAGSAVGSSEVQPAAVGSETEFPPFDIPSRLRLPQDINWQFDIVGDALAEVCNCRSSSGGEFGVLSSGMCRNNDSSYPWLPFNIDKPHQ